MDLYHVSTWPLLANVQPGDQFVLVPGKNNAEGIGVYFAEAQERVSAADAVHAGGQHTATVIISTENSVGWWRSKKSSLKKRGRARTWHSAQKAITCQVISIKEKELRCSWKFMETKCNMP
jgi:hypothetical protein